MMFRESSKGVSLSPAEIELLSNLQIQNEKIRNELLMYRVVIADFNDFFERENDVELYKRYLVETYFFEEDNTPEKRNQREDIITSMHWRDPLPDQYDEKTLERLLKENAPCISAFGLKKSFGQAVVRNEIDKYSTKFDASVNIVAPGNLIPITFAEHFVDEKLMSPKRGAPVLSRQNRFTGWKATFTVQYMDGGSYSAEQIVQVINLAGFGLGIGSGRTSGYGRYHVVGVE
jgi:hypothetical protein